MQTEKNTAIRQIGSIPSMPQVVTRFLEVVQDPDFKYDDLVEVLSTDPGTTAEILRIVNSPLFGVARKITSLRPALTLLGPRRLRSMVLGRYLVESVNQQIGDLDGAYYWRRSLTCGVVSARLAEMLAPRMREEAFISGLLSDIGVTLLAQEMPANYAPILAMYGPNGRVDLADAERQAVGMTHGELSASVLSHWQLPEIVCSAVAKHQAAVRSTGVPEHLARIISAADRISKVLCESPAVETLAGYCESTMESIQLDIPALLKVLDDIESDIAEFAGLLRLEIVPQSSYQIIARTLSGYAELSLSGDYGV